MPDTPAKFAIGSRTFQIAPLRMGLFRTDAAARAAITRKPVAGAVFDHEMVDGMMTILFAAVDQADPASAITREAFSALVDGLLPLDGITQVSDAYLAVLAASGFSARTEGAGSGEAPAGTAPSASPVSATSTD